MGMFSWVCKGCGHELKSGEFVRMNGYVGEYDGYGNAGGFTYENNEPSCWHVRCYKNATNEQKLNDTPSKYAQNQGFGHTALENREFYDPKYKIMFLPVIYVDHYDGEIEKTMRQEWYIVDGVLVDQLHYESLYEVAGGEGGVTESMFKDRADDWYDTANKEEQDAFFQLVEETVEKHIGMKRPRTNVKWFDDFEQAKTTVEALIPSLPNPNWGYELVIFGKQPKANGLFYKYSKTPGFNMVDIPGKFYPNGKSKLNFVFDDTFEEEVAFMHNTPASDTVKPY